MALFKNKDTALDTDFTFMTKAEAKAFRELVAEAFSRQGNPVTQMGDHCRGPEGDLYGLVNLAAQCHQNPLGQTAWPVIVADHIKAVLAANAEPSEPLSIDELRARAVLRLVDRTSVPDIESHFSYARPWGDTVIELIAIDYPEYVSYAREEDVKGIKLDDLRAVALENLRRQPIEERSSTEAAGGGVLHSIAGSSVYASSRAILLEEELDALGDHPHGALFIIPDRHNLHIHILRDSTFAGALQTLANVAIGVYSEGAYTLSPHVYWWHDGEVTQVSSIHKGKKYNIEPNDDLVAVFTALSEIEPA